MDDVRYRWIDGPTASDADWDTIDLLMATSGWPSLNRATTRIRLAEDATGKVLGFSVLQLFPHAEPLWVAPSARGTGIAEKLTDDMFAFLQEVRVRGFLVVASSPFAQRLCEQHGMKPLEHPVYAMPIGSE